ncbi:MAG: hypothetical protein Q7T04_06315 [Dehalococcoidia bacterium]|nr:hypothetical protein [Dehalococcoidia bacterium]
MFSYVPETDDYYDPMPWTGATVRLYGYPVTEGVPSYGFLPKNGTDPKLLENLEQAAFFLGEGPGGASDCLLTIPPMVTLAGRPVAPADLIAEGTLQLFAVSDTGQFSVGEQVKFVQPYSLTVKPSNVKPGETVLVEGMGLQPANDRVSITATLRYAKPEGGTSSIVLKVADVETANGRLSSRWQVPGTVDLTQSRESYVPGSAVLVQPQEATLEVRYPALVLRLPSTAPPIPSYIATATPSGPSSKTLYTLSLFIGMDKMPLK